MIECIDIQEQEILELSRTLLETLLKDRTTEKNIVWATDDYKYLGENFSADKPITIELITGDNKFVIQPRVEKSKANQAERTKQKAEVFTPSWICNLQNNLVDDAWFDRKNVFNIAEDKTWQATKEKINFENLSWQEYVESNRLEITCGEAPYLVSRYDTTTGEYIEVPERIGLLDRKLRVINEQIDDEEEWFKWLCVAYQSIYGYEYQGDSLLLARENLLYDFIDNYKYKFNTTKKPKLAWQNKIARIISWNIWQMDGLTCTVPYGDEIVNIAYNERLFTDEIDISKEKKTETKHKYCVIKDWKQLNEKMQKVRFIDLIKNHKG